MVSVLATGANDYNQCDVADWKNIVMITARKSTYRGMQSDGTVLATGWNNMDNALCHRGQT
jgi:hypothetical protein